MKTIKFTAACTLRDYRVGTPDEESYAVGQVVTLSDDKAERWLRRMKAVEVEPLPPVIPEPPPQPALIPEPAPAAPTEEFELSAKPRSRGRDKGD